MEAVSGDSSKSLPPSRAGRFDSGSGGCQPGRALSERRRNGGLPIVGSPPPGRGCRATVWLAVQVSAPRETARWVAGSPRPRGHPPGPAQLDVALARPFAWRPHPSASAVVQRAAGPGRRSGRARRSSSVPSVGPACPASVVGRSSMANPAWPGFRSALPSVPHFAGCGWEGAVSAKRSPSPCWAMAQAAPAAVCWGVARGAPKRGGVVSGGSIHYCTPTHPSPTRSRRQPGGRFSTTGLGLVTRLEEGGLEDGRLLIRPGALWGHFALIGRSPTYSSARPSCTIQVGRLLIRRSPRYSEKVAYLFVGNPAPAGADVDKAAPIDGRAARAGGRASARSGESSAGPSAAAPRHDTEPPLRGFHRGGVLGIRPGYRVALLAWRVLTSGPVDRTRTRPRGNSTRSSGQTAAIARMASRTL